MTAPTENRAAAYLASLAEAGYARVEPPILQPASAFLDLSGEDLRRRMFLTSDEEGRELCLRPDLTIPTALLHLERADPAAAASYCYLGPVFRFRQNGPDEFTQAGLEIFGRPDREAADAEVVARAAEAVAIWDVGEIEIRVGDIGLFVALLDALALPPAWRRRLARDVARTGRLERDLAELNRRAETGGAPTALLSALEGTDPRAAHAGIEDLLEIAGFAHVGGRSAADITDRFLEKARLADGRLPADVHRLALDMLAIAGPPDVCAAELRRLADGAGLTKAARGESLKRGMEALERRTDLMRERGLDTTAIRMATAFGRQIDYYSGLVFEIHARRRPDLAPLAAGGRYDDLLHILGAPSSVPAVGCAIWLERIEEAAR